MNLVRMMSGDKINDKSIERNFRIKSNTKVS